MYIKLVTNIRRVLNFVVLYYYDIDENRYPSNNNEVTSQYLKLKWFEWTYDLPSMHSNREYTSTRFLKIIN